jgi:hypothetical protein
LALRTVNKHIALKTVTNKHCRDVHSKWLACLRRRATGWFGKVSDSSRRWFGEHSPRYTPNSNTSTHYRKVFHKNVKLVPTDRSFQEKNLCFRITLFGPTVWEKRPIKVFIIRRKFFREKKLKRVGGNGLGWPIQCAGRVDVEGRMGHGRWWAARPRGKRPGNETVPGRFFPLTTQVVFQFQTRPAQRRTGQGHRRR